MEKQGMKTIYFNSLYKFTIVDATEEETLLCTSLEELQIIMETHRSLVARVAKGMELSRKLKEAQAKGLVSKTLAKELDGLL
jgi:hypothetical protein